MSRRIPPPRGYDPVEIVHPFDFTAAQRQQILDALPCIRGQELNDRGPGTLRGQVPVASQSVPRPMDASGAKRRLDRNRSPCGGADKAAPFP